MNYTELVALAKAYSDREDVEVADNIDVFITMAESRINRVLKTREQTAKVLTPTTGLESYTLPADFAGMRTIRMDSPSPASDIDFSFNAAMFTYITPEQFAIKRGAGDTGTAYYTVVANQIQITPIASTGLSIEMVYYQKVPNLATLAPTNWLSVSHPDIYVAGIVAEIELFAKNYEVAKGWYDRMSVAINELDVSDTEERWSGTALSIKVG